MLSNTRGLGDIPISERARFLASSRKRRPGVRARRVAVAAAALLAAALVLAPAAAFAAPSSSSGGYPPNTFPATAPSTTITWWTFTANAKSQVAAFNKVYPNIHVDTPLVGSDYTKLTTVVKGGSGGPDVAEIEYEYLPKFIATGGILDISKYVDKYKNLFYPWTWTQVSQGSAVYGVPQDVGPTALTYQPAVFAKDGLTVPKTWAEFAADARVIHDKNPKQYITYVPLNDGAWWTMLYWQAGAVMFKNTSQGWQVDLNSSVVKKVTDYWAGLIKDGLVDPTQDWTPSWENSVGQGTYAAMAGATWTPDYMVHPFSNAATANAWRMTDFPQWSTGDPVGANVGGASNVVLKQSKHPAAAALFAAWIDGSQQGVTTRITSVDKGGQGMTAAASNSDLLPAFSAPSSALGGQDPSPVISKAAASVNPNYQWSPWSDYVFNEMTIEFTKAANGNETWNQALDNLQHNVSVFGASMGYTMAPAPSGQSSGSAESAPSPALWVVIGLAVLAIAAFIYRRRLTAES
ncbi:MAG: multiple sugar transport system substrate-binding protein [Microbacteriaceae bacterium]|jgi:multiple sugar transport system substrate-binding protein|nr:transporter substrate-binding protein [Microbacteriaceae bacterium]MDQ1549855.1 multiple sugar transport system substrate-binding protein [Microbacteriaceae bacterium]